MLEDRIIVQDRGIDAGLAALMQNANKGMDPAALMAMMNNNGGFGGNGGWWWIWIILIWFCWGGNGFGGRLVHLRRPQNIMQGLQYQYQAHMMNHYQLINFLCLTNLGRRQQM